MLHETLEYLGIAFICSVLLIIMSKIILQALIRRPADYYDARELEQEELMLNAAGISLASEHETNPEGEIIEESHLEAHHTDFEAAEPEEIMEEVSESVAESLVTFVHDSLPDDDEDFIEEDNEEVQDEAAAEKETVTEEETTSETVVETETETVTEEKTVVEAVVETEKETVTEEETVKPQDAAQTDAESEPDQAEYEDKPDEDLQSVREETQTETETAEEDNESASDGNEFISPESDEPVGFSIKAKTSRTKRPKKHEEEEAAEELELARAAMEEARNRDTAHDAGTDEAVADSAESVEEIRSSLEKAFAEHSKKPSMRMTKKQLTEIAESLGIEIPAGATKKIILELINSVREEQQ